MRVCLSMCVSPSQVCRADLHLVDMRPQVAAPVAHAYLPTASAAPPDLESALLALFEQNVPNLYEHIEETVFRAAYRYCHGNQLQTGRLLNISRNIVRARLEKIGELSKA